MHPALRALATGVQTPLSEIRKRVAAAEGLLTEEVREGSSNSRKPVCGKRELAVIHMAHAGLPMRVRRGVYRLTG